MRLTIEFDVPESQAHLINKLAAYAKRIGVTASARGSHDANEPFRRPNDV